MIGIGRYRLEASLNLMLPLSARIETLQLVLNAVFLALVVARFEM